MILDHFHFKLYSKTMILSYFKLVPFSLHDIGEGLSTGEQPAEKASQADYIDFTKLAFTEGSTNTLCQAVNNEMYTGR